jgi:Sec-independent protein secretion pathway component TatC
VIRLRSSDDDDDDDDDDGGKNVKYSKFKLINQPYAAINYRFIACRLKTAQHTYFGHPYAHHQEPINCSSSLWFTVGYIYVYFVSTPTCFDASESSSDSLIYSIYIVYIYIFHLFVWILN